MQIKYTQVILSVYYILTYFNTIYLKKLNILYLYIGFDVSVIYSSCNTSLKMATEGGLKHVEALRRLYCNKFT
jgi:hypothetical protein